MNDLKSMAGRVDQIGLAHREWAEVAGMSAWRLSRGLSGHLVLTAQEISRLHDALLRILRKHEQVVREVLAEEATESERGQARAR